MIIIPASQRYGLMERQRPRWENGDNVFHIYTQKQDLGINQWA